MQLSETDIRCDVCALRIKTERNEPMRTIVSSKMGKTFHVHALNTNPAWRDHCDDRADAQGWR